MSFRDKYRTIAEQLLGRLLQENDGIPTGEIKSQAAEKGFVLPLALADYYSVAANLELNTAHNRLLPPNELNVDFEETTMVFMDENQSVCAWGIHLDDLKNDDPLVYQGQPSDSDWHSEECSTSEWLEICLYLQCCWGGLKFSCDTMGPKSVMPEIRENWQKVVDHNGLTIWKNDGVLVSDMGQPWCNAAANTDEGLAKLEQLGFEPQ
ncbi:hypothetical protein OAG34_00805 [bacterium]|jgi:hypothetical protein|nr:hypothetical protein [bacterium]